MRGVEDQAKSSSSKPAGLTADNRTGTIVHPCQIGCNGDIACTIAVSAKDVLDSRAIGTKIVQSLMVAMALPDATLRD